jgi:hypothetical protein
MISSALFAFAVCALQSGAAAAAPAEDVIVFNRATLAEAGEDAQTIELRAMNDQIKVIVNGKELDASRIQKKDGQVIVLDEHGDVIQKFDLNAGMAFGDGQFEWNLDFGDDLGELHKQIDQWRELGWAQKQPFMEAEAPKVMLGVHMDEPSEALVRHLQLKRGETTILNGVLEGLPAHKSGLDAYDIIIAINGKSPAGQQQVHEALRQLNPGDSIGFTVIHNGQRKDVTVKVDAYNAESLHSANVIGEARSAVFGTVLPGLQGGDLRMLELPRGGEIMEMLLVPDPQNQDGAWRHRALIAPQMQLKLRTNTEGDEEAALEQSIEDGLEDAVKADVAELGDRLKRLEELLQKLAERHKESNEE